MKKYLKITSNVTLFCQIPSSSFISSTSEIVAFTFTEIWFIFDIISFFIEFRVKTVLIPSSRFPSVFSKGSGAISIVYESLG